MKEKRRRKMAAVICLWLAYMMSNAAYSLFAPFLPEEVRGKTIAGSLVSI